MQSPATVLLTLAVFLATACSDGRTVPSDEGRVLLEQRHKDFLDAIAAKDANRVAQLFSDSAVVHVANMPSIERREAIRQFYENMFGFLSASNVVPEITQISECGSMAYSVGRTSNVFQTPQGTREYEGKFTLVWEKAEDDWMIALYSISSNQAESTQ